MLKNSKERASDNSTVHLCTDGKARSGCIDPRTGRTELDLTIFDADSACIIATESLETKQGEKDALKKGLDTNRGRLKGALLTGDAGMTSILKDDTIANSGMDALIQIKRNAGFSYHEAQSLPWEQVITKETETNQGHGRQEHRVTRVIDLGYVENEIQDKYSNVEAIVQIEKWSKNIKSGAVSHSFRYYLGTKMVCELSVNKVGKIIRDHWKIETFHNTKDVTLGEDRSMIVSSNASRFTARIRAMVARLGKVYGSTKKFIESFSQNPHAVAFS